LRRRCLEMAVQPHEEKRGADPGDRGDDMDPPHHEVEPFLQQRVHHSSFTSSARRKAAIRPICSSAAANSSSCLLSRRAENASRIYSWFRPLTAMMNGKPNFLR